MTTSSPRQRWSGLHAHRHSRTKWRGNRRPAAVDGRAPFVNRAEWMDQEPITKFIEELLEQRKK
jgi:hypothetical protein